MSEIYAVVEFTTSQTVAVVPCTWLSRNQKQCKWPPDKKNGRKIDVKSLVKSCAERSASWTTLAVRVMGKYSSYDKAHSKMILAQTKSDLESAAEDRRRNKSKSHEESPLAVLPIPKIVPKTNAISISKTPREPQPSTSTFEPLSLSLSGPRIRSFVLEKGSTGKSRSESYTNSSRSAHISTKVAERKRKRQSPSRERRPKSNSGGRMNDDDFENELYVSKSRSKSPRDSRGFYSETPHPPIFKTSRVQLESFNDTDMQLILRGQANIQIQLKETRAQLDSIRNLLLGDRRNGKKSEEFPLPLMTMNDVHKFEKRLGESVSLRDWLQDEFISIGGSWLREGVRLSLRKLMDDGLATQYSWAGQNGNIKFKGLQMCNVLIRAMKECYKMSELEVQAKIADCLKHTKDPEKNKAEDGADEAQNDNDEIRDGGSDQEQIENESNTNSGSEDEDEHSKRFGYSAFSDDD